MLHLRAWQTLTIGLLFLSVIVFGLAWLGWLQVIYTWIYTHTTGEPWTYIIRRHPVLLLVVPEAVLMAILGLVLPERRWARVVLIPSVLLMGFLGGHVIWGG